MNTPHPVERAAKALGSEAALASLLQVTRGAVNQWKGEGRKVPAEYCPTIEKATRQKAAEAGDATLVVPCEELRPDIEWNVLREAAA
jgi:DNA-binding transcriptional regulator YdaS (Cro superfamily)